MNRLPTLIDPPRPEHKVKIVQALKNADISVATGITGTEVTKEALSTTNFSPTASCGLC